MAILVTTIIDEVARALADAGKTRWSQAEHVDYLNRGLEEIASKLPKAFLKTATVSCTKAGDYVITGARFVSVILDNNSNTVPVELTKNFLLRNDANWKGTGTEGAVKAFARDEADPKRFYLYPQRSSGSVTVSYIAEPTQVAVSGSTYTPTTIDLPDHLAPALVAYMLSRSFAKDDEAGSQQMAQSYAQAFITSLSSDKTYA